MTALAFYSIFGIKNTFYYSFLFYKINFKLNNLIKILKTDYNEYLFNKYCEELNDTFNKRKIDENYNKRKLISSDMNANKEQFEDDFDIEDIEIISGEEVVDFGCRTKPLSRYSDYEPPLVYSDYSLNNIAEGVSFSISGSIPTTCERFAINLVINNQTKDIALHLNPRLPQNHVVRNCRIKNVWGTEEITTGMPFRLKRGSKFTIQILLTKTEYLISIDGEHFAAYRHRLPLNLVNGIEVKGDVENIEVLKTEADVYPKRLPESRAKDIMVSCNASDCSKITTTLANNNLMNIESMKLPFYGKLPVPFVRGKRLQIDGRIKILPHSFIINLQSSSNIWPHPSIAFHFNPRFLNGKHILCRNSWSNGKWDDEERIECNTDLGPGKFFSLRIYCTDTSYNIYLNRKYLGDFLFRLEPEIVKTLHIQGDIILLNVNLDSYTKIEDEAIGEFMLTN